METSTLSSVPPPDITYTLALPASDSGALSALQLEAITYACQVISGLPPSQPTLCVGGPSRPWAEAAHQTLTALPWPAATRGLAPQRAAGRLPHR